MIRSPRDPARIVRPAVFFILGIAAAALIFVGCSIAYFVMSRRSDFAEQRSRLEAYALMPPDAASPSLYADRSIPDELPFDALRMIATHNSYRKRADPLRLLFIELAESGEAKKLAYEHPPLWTQLESGVRSFELDLRLRVGRFECAHVPLVDDRSTVPDFALALRELALWSDRRPGHVPLVLLLELKADYRFLDPGLKAWDQAALAALDAVLRKELGPRLFAPDELRGTFPNPAAAIAERGWPLLGSLRGRIVVLLHENETYRETYLSLGDGGRAMFTSVSGKAAAVSPVSELPLFVIANDPIGEKHLIGKLSSGGRIVRTRSDADGVADRSVLAAALASGAQIVSTDHPPAYPAEDGYAAAFSGGATLSMRGDTSP